MKRAPMLENWIRIELKRVPLNSIHVRLSMGAN